MQSKDSDFFAHLIFALVHFSWFVIYYSKFSTLNQKLTSIDKMDRAGVITPELAEKNRLSVNEKITILRKKCFYPNPAIAVAHIVYLESINISIKEEYPAVIGVTAGGIVLILLANVVKGRTIMDKNKRFSGNPFD